VLLYFYFPWHCKTGDWLLVPAFVRFMLLQRLVDFPNAVHCKLGHIRITSQMVTFTRGQRVLEMSLREEACLLHLHGVAEK